MFERIETFFRRLDIYTKVAPNQGMVDTITAIMVEVLNFIGIATKEMKQCRTSKPLPYRQVPADKSFAAKYLKKLMGKNDIEDTLKRLDRLTQEEARMAAAQLLGVTNTIDTRVWGIGDNLLVIDNRVTDVDDRVACIDDRVACVDDRVKDVDVDDKVKVVDDKSIAVIDGAHVYSINH
jgi:hypothetical protein